MSQDYTDFNFLKTRATKLVNKIAPAYYSEALAEDMAMAGIEWLYKHENKQELYYQDVRTAMLDEMFRWMLNVTAHQKRRQTQIIEWQDWVSKYTRSARDSVERQVMARECIKKITTDKPTKSVHKRRRRKKAIKSILEGDTGRHSNTRTVFMVRREIKNDILDYLPKELPHLDIVSNCKKPSLGDYDNNLVY